MHYLKFNMRRQAPAYVILVCLLLVASPHHGSAITAQAVDSEHFKLKPAKPNSRSGGKLGVPTWIDGRNVHKLPSGPNPVGNHRPPQRG